MNIRPLSENQLQKFLKSQIPPYVFLETISFDKENKNSYLFNDFVDILTFNRSDDLEDFFKRAQSYLDKGYWLCGYFSYELGYFLEPALYPLREKNNLPLIWLGVCKKPISLDYQKKYSSHQFSPADLTYEIKNIKPNITYNEYSECISKIKHYLEEGLTYQVNFTFKLKFDFIGNILDFYLNLRRAQPTPYAALIDADDQQIISLSPELFFKVENNKIVTRPMKGTIERGLTTVQDNEFKKIIAGSEKTKAENVMIVDLLRNDLGRIAKAVWVPKLFEIEKYRTLHQMTSTIEAKLKDKLTLKDIFSSLFPCGSVTGAPKIKTMEIIKTLEKEPRGIYTGAIGYISPDKKMCFNVAIRTIHLKQGQGELGVGGGIVYDSLEAEEYKEAILKAKFFIEGFSNVSLIETILWQDGQYFLLDLHLMRLKNSCEYFSIPLDIRKLEKKIRKLSFAEKGKLKLRLLVDMAGQVSTQISPLDEITQPVKVKISSETIDSKDAFLYHKTTRRDLYDKEKAKAEKEGFFEVVFLNERGELTEGSISNIFIEKNGQLYTPALDCGLLPGVLRGDLINKGQAREKILYLKDIWEADKVYIGNSLRGLLEAKLSLADLENESKIKTYAKNA